MEAVPRTALRRAGCLVLLLALQAVAAGGARYLVITADEFASAVQPLVEWRHKKGMQTAVVKMSEIVPQTSEGIRNCIVNAYKTWNPRPEYVLLVGDTEQIPVGQTSPCYSDNYYADVDGHFKAELAVGRFPCRTVDECRVMVAKTLWYERHPLTGDTAWYRRALAAVRFDHAGDTLGYYVRDTRYFISLLRDQAGFTVDSMFWREGEGWHGQGPDSARQIVAALNRGAGYVLFRGFGAWDGTFHNWNPPMNVQPEGMANGFRLPVVYGGCCQTVFAPEGKGVGEAWVRVGTVLAPKGAVAYLGNSIHAMAAAWRSKVKQGFYRSVFVYDTLTLGRALLFGKDSLYRWMRANGQPDTTRDSIVRYIEQSIIGDPALQLWTDYPRAITVQHPTAVPAGPGTLRVSVRRAGVPCAGALVCAVKDDEFYSFGHTDSGGTVSLNINARSAGEFAVTVTGRNLRPYEGTCHVDGGDAGVTRVLAPTGTYFAGAVVTPACSVRNFGSKTLRPYTVRMRIGPYNRAVAVADSHRANTSRYVVFPACTTVVGVFAVVCSTELVADERAANDRAEGMVSVRPNWPKGWSRAASVPLGSGPKPKPVKDGAWLVYHAGTGTLIGTKGNKTVEFFSYNPSTDQWKALAPIPAVEGGKEKPAGKGCRGVSDGRRYIYMVKGNNTLGFWRYDVEQDSWQRMKDVPAGPGKKAVKGGSDLVYVSRRDTGYVYLLKGYLTEFYRYNVRKDKWDTLENAPDASGQGKYQKGSFLVYDGNRTIYAHQSGYNDGRNHYMFKYDIDAERWQTQRLNGMPLAGRERGKRKDCKSGDGAAAAWDTDSRNYFYALKGGGSQGFYRYSVVNNTWTEIDTVPRKGYDVKAKCVKAGADLVGWGAGTYFALKGNNTCELWRFVAPADAQLSGAQAGKSAVGGLQFVVCPNPIASGFATLRLASGTVPTQNGSNPGQSLMQVRVFDAAGRCVLAHQLATGNWHLGITLDLRKVPAGVYLVRLDVAGMTASLKLVVQK